MKKLPIGYSSLEKVISENCTYVDKTKFVKMMVDAGEYYFLSRPRRFGKSLFLDTLKQAFLGNKELFKGLYIEDKWEWDKKYPVIHIDFSNNQATGSEKIFSLNVLNILGNIATSLGIELRGKIYSSVFDNLIKDVYNKFNSQVVILIDEYDKPILDVIGNTEDAKVVRNALRSFYSNIKANDSRIRFVLLTGVTKFSKVSLFSGINNLQDITIDDRFADICGYTQADLERVFADRLNGVDKELLKQWYNGYSFGGKEEQKVYNPFDILLFFEKGNKYANYWFETATPNFLINLLKQNKYYFPKLEQLQVSEKILGSFDVDKITIETLLFQSGYLTIENMFILNNKTFYKFNYPNLEVKQGLQDYILSYFLPDVSAVEGSKIDLITSIEGNDFDKIKEILTSFFAGIPYNWYVKNNIAEYEGFYSAIVYALFSASGYAAVPEDTTNKGRIDLSIVTQNKVILFEFKVNENTDTGNALEQIKEKNYQEKYLNCNKPIYLVGVNFSSEKRNLVNYEWERVVVSG